MNVYYDVSDVPNDTGLVRVDTFEEDLSYEYHILLVVKSEVTGRVFYAEDSGCSCPTPFEDYHFNSPDDTDMDEVKKGDSFTSFERAVQAFPTTQAERDALIYAVKQLI